MPRSSATSACSGPRSWLPRSAPSWCSRLSSACFRRSSSSRWDRRSSASWTCSASSARTSRNEESTMNPASTILLALALAGCSGAPTLPDEAAPARADRAAVEKLYDGQPAAVHATEFPVASAAEGMARGDQAWRKGQLDLAVYLYVQSLAYDAKNPEPLLRIGAIHERRGNRALAERAFEMALQLDPENPGINERLGL